MEHIKYNGYPEEFLFVCCEGKRSFLIPCHFSKRKETKMVDAFFKDLEEHGYDVIKPIDGEEYEKAVGIINESSRLWSIALSQKTYHKYIFDGEINRCGKWVFITSGRCKFDFVELKQGRGGRRKGAGRKSCASRLLFENETTTIRVPAIFKETFKQMSTLFIEQASSGVNVRSILSDASWHLERVAMEYREKTYNKEPCEELAMGCDRDRAFIDKLSDLIPYIYLKEEYNRAVTESNKQ